MSWTALTRHIGKIQHFIPNISKANVFGLLLGRSKIVRVIEENAYLKKDSTLQQENHKFGFKC